jgi:hypothetical protein
MTQVEPYDRWPSGEGWTVAVTRATPEEIAEQAGLTFEPGVDDLDQYVLAAIADGDIGQFWLIRHENAPERGVEVVVDRAVDRTSALRALRRHLPTEYCDFAWLAPAELPVAS